MSEPTRRTFLRATLGLAAAALAGTAAGQAQSLGQDTRTVEGKVLDSDGKPRPNAIVYLQNQKSLSVRTYIATSNGAYRFGGLSTDADYQLWAKYHNERSKTRSISSFSSRKQFVFDLKLEPQK